MAGTYAFNKTALTLLAAGAVFSGSARADLLAFDETTFDHGLFHTNSFNWADFDLDDVVTSFPALYPDQAPNGITPYVSERFTYDDNVYRLPKSSIVTPLGQVASRGDEINTVSAGFDSYVGVSGQGVELLARADRNEFSKNGNLDYTSGTARLVGDWQIGSELTGQVGASYDRQLNDFANYQVYTKDLVSVESAFARAHLDLGSLIFDAGGSQLEVSHSSDNAKFRANSAQGTATYRTPGGTYLSAIFNYNDARFPLPQSTEDSFLLQVNSPLGKKLRFRVAGGYVRHDYSQDTVPVTVARYNFSGGIWNADLAWQPRESLQFLLAGAREVRAYVDADSQYFVSQSERAVLQWAPTGKLTCELEYSRDDQHFFGPLPTVISLTLPEHNVIYARQLNVAWSMLRPVQLVLTYRYVTRSSNAPILAFDDSFVSARLQARF
jgi:hypothetical protein